jgi:18S rRNA (adenine1779-N6/adenine1780-N6)-dimethyltransferase
VDSIVAKVDIKPTDNVLEIGPGTGNLTVQQLPEQEIIVMLWKEEPMMCQAVRAARGGGGGEAVNIF